MIDIFWNRGNKTIRINPIVSKCTCSKADDSIGTLKFTLDTEKKGDIEFILGDTILVPDMNDTTKTFFRGRIFNIAYNNNDEVEITVYDILKYLDGSRYYVFPTIDYGSVIKVICADLAIEYGYLEDTPNIPAKLYTSTGYGDILAEYEEYLLYTNNKKYVHRVENNALVMRDLDDLVTNYAISSNIVTDYSYTESAEDVKNVIEITQLNETTNEYSQIVVGDTDLMDQLGVLSMTQEDTDSLSYENLLEKANVLLEINSQMQYNLSITIPDVADFNVYDVITVNINEQSNYGYISSIEWDLMELETNITLSILGK